jgi:hypothetical protein
MKAQSSKLKIPKKLQSSNSKPQGGVPLLVLGYWKLSGAWNFELGTLPA